MSSGSGEGVSGVMLAGTVGVWSMGEGGTRGGLVAAREGVGSTLAVGGCSFTSISFPSSCPGSVPAQNGSLVHKVHIKWR